MKYAVFWGVKDAMKRSLFTKGVQIPLWIEGTPSNFVFKLDVIKIETYMYIATFNNNP